MNSVCTVEVAQPSSSYSNTNDANATLTFSGDAVAVYGGVSFDHGVYTVSVDGQTQQLNGANGQARVYHPKVRFIVLSRDRNVNPALVESARAFSQRNSAHINSRRLFSTLRITLEMELTTSRYLLAMATLTLTKSLCTKRLVVKRVPELTLVVVWK